MAQLNFPDTPSPGDVYAAPNGVNYTYTLVNGLYVWLAESAAALSITNPGSISGSAQVGATLSYTTGTATGGSGTITYTWLWKYESTGTQIPGTAASAPSISVPTGAYGDRIYVELTATDAASNTATADTTYYPASPNTIARAAFPNTVWNPTPSNGLDSIPGLQSASYSGTATSITTTGCIEAAVGAGSFTIGTQPITPPQNLSVRWSTSVSAPACGGAASGTPLTGSITDGTYEKIYNIVINRIPTPTIADITDTGVSLGGTVSKGIASPVAGINTTAYVTYDAASTGTVIGASTSAGGPFTPLATSGIGFPITDGQTLYIQQTVGGAVNTSPGYTAIIRVGDGTNTAGTYDEFTYFAQTVATATFPGVTFTPSGPNAAPETVSAVAGGGTLGTLNGTANSVAWPAGLGTTLSSPGTTPTMKMRVNGAGAFATSGVNIVPTDILNLAWNEAYLTTVGDGLLATGTFTGTVGASTYTNTYTMTVKRSAAWTAPTGVTSVALSTAVNSGSLIVNDFNVPVTVSFGAPSGPSGATAMTAGIAYSIGTGPVVPGNISTTFTLNPGETLTLYGDTGGATGTKYGYSVTIGTALPQTWFVTTTTLVPAITTPSITAPTGSPPALLNPALNSPAGLTLTGSTYSPNAAAGAVQTSSTWEVAKDGPLSTFQSTATISGVSAAAVPAVGAAYGGGYFGGQISTAGNGVADYNLVVAPKEGNTSGPATGGALKGQYGGATPTTIQYRTTNAADAAAAQNLVYGGTVSDLYKASALHPLFNTTWLNSATGPNGGTMNLATGGLGGGAGIGGYTDWYVPAKNELEVLYYFLKPETTSNFVNGSGSNANAVTPEPVSTAYTAGSPGQTSAGLFQQGNPQAFTTQYWSSSEVSTGTTNAWSQSFASFNNGNQDAGNKANLNAARAIRRVGVTGIGSSQTLAITGADTDGFTVGMKVKGSSSNATGIITAINGTSVTITQTSATNWTTTDKIQGNGTAITGSPLSGTVQVGATPPSVFIPQASLAVSSTYYARTQYATTNTGAATSDFSAWSSFATAASFLPAAIGSALGGGYFAGQILDGTTVYNLIVAPKLGDTSGPNPAGTLKGQSTASLQYRTSNAGDAAAASNQTYGGTVSDLYKASTLHPLFNNTWLNNSTGPNGGTMNLATGGLGGGNGIGGYTDWYVPAKNELEVLYYYFKPNSTGTQPNDTTSGSNPNAVSPEPISTNYTASNPAQTTATAFQGSNAQAFSTADYWSATENANPILAWQQNFSGGLQAGVGKISANSARAIRRVAA